MKRAKRALNDDLDDADDDGLQPLPKEARTFAARLCDAFVQEEGLLSFSSFVGSLATASPPALFGAGERMFVKGAKLYRGAKA